MWMQPKPNHDYELNYIRFRLIPIPIPFTVISDSEAMKNAFGSSTLR